MRLDFHLSEQKGGPHIPSSLSNWLYTSSYVLEFATFGKIIQSRCWDLIQRKFLAEIMVPLRANIYLSTIFNSWKLKTIRRLERTFHLPLVWERWFFEVNLLIFTDGWNYCNAFIIQKLFFHKESRKQEKYAKNSFCFFSLDFIRFVSLCQCWDGFTNNDNVNWDVSPHPLKKLNNICSSYKWFSYLNFAFILETLIYLNATIPM